jgi:hypothetical protein
MKKKHEHKPVIETIINTAAIAISGYGIIQIQMHDYYGFICILFAAGLEFFKYWGRNKDLW